MQPFFYWFVVKTETPYCARTLWQTLMSCIKGGSNKVINMAQYLVLLWSTVISILLLNSITFCFLMLLIEQDSQKLDTRLILLQKVCQQPVSNSICSSYKDSTSMCGMQKGIKINKSLIIESYNNMVSYSQINKLEFKELFRGGTKVWDCRKIFAYQCCLIK